MLYSILYFVYYYLSNYATLFLMNKAILVFWGIIIAVILGGVSLSYISTSGPSKFDSLAQCIKDKGIVFYGAFWCPHCQRTKAMFGTAEKVLPYHECSTPDGKGQVKECTDLGINGYPTWISPATTTRLTGEHTMAEIASFTSCQLPK